MTMEINNNEVREPTNNTIFMKHTKYTPINIYKETTKQFKKIASKNCTPIKLHTTIEVSKGKKIYIKLKNIY